MEKIWEQEITDVMKFTLTRGEWENLVRALAGAACRVPYECRSELWNALDSLKNAEDARS